MCLPNLKGQIKGTKMERLTLKLWYTLRCYHSNPSPMEGETSKLKAYRGGWIDAASEKLFMQKMLIYVEAQAEVLKKIIDHLSKIEKEEAEKCKVEHEPSGLTQKGINCVMAEGKICLPLPNFKPQLKDALGPWTFKRSHVNDFSE